MKHRAGRQAFQLFSGTMQDAILLQQAILLFAQQQFALVQEGDVIALTDKSKDLPKIKAVLEANDGNKVPAWLELDANANSVKVATLAKREDIEYEINETLIVELYSK